MFAATALGAHEAIRPAPARDGDPPEVFGAIQGHEKGHRETLLKLDAVAS